MADSKKNSIKFRINNIETLQFAQLTEHVNDDNLAIKVSFGFGHNSKIKSIRCKFRFELLSDKNPALIIEIAMDFGIIKESYDEMISNNGDFVIPKNFATHLAMIAVGTSRGILYEKTKETSLKSYFLPTIDITQRINEDIIIRIKQNADSVK